MQQINLVITKLGRWIFWPAGQVSFKWSYLLIPQQDLLANQLEGELDIINLNKQLG
jgi:hypothetical protein